MKATALRHHDQIDPAPPVQRNAILGEVPAAGDDAPPRNDRPVDAFRFYKLAATADVTGPAKAVLWVLAHHANHRSGRAFCYVETIGREAGLRARATQMAIRNLEALGIIDVATGTKRYSREQGANIYTFTERGASHAPQGCISCTHKKDVVLPS